MGPEGLVKSFHGSNIRVAYRILHNKDAPALNVVRQLFSVVPGHSHASRHWRSERHEDRGVLLACDGTLKNALESIYGTVS